MRLLPAVMARARLPLRMRNTTRKMTMMMTTSTMMEMMRTLRMSSCFVSAAYPFWHLLIKGEC
jgi:hypothetical protein